VEGTGPEARWNSSGVGVGSYTVNVKVDDGKGGTASCAADIKVEEKPNRPPTATLSIERSPDSAGRAHRRHLQRQRPGQRSADLQLHGDRRTDRGKRLECAV